MRNILTFSFLSLLFLGCEKDAQEPIISVNGYWRLTAMGFHNYTDSVESQGWGIAFEDPITYQFENGIIYSGYNLVGNYSTSSIKFNSDTITYTITNLSSEEMWAKQYPNGLANGSSQVYIFRR